MKALCWYGKRDLRVSDLPVPRILSPGDAIVKVHLSAICGSDLHIYGGFVPGMHEGDVLGHEFVGEVFAVGDGVRNFNPGDRVAASFTISCGGCYYCKNGMWSLCDNSNPNSTAAEALYGFSPSGIYGYSHLFGGFAGGQAEYVRVPFADNGLLKLPQSVSYDQAIFLCDVFPTGYMAAENCSIMPGDIVAVWGAGPVGLFALKSASMLGAGTVIAIDRLPVRLSAAASFAGALTINQAEEDVFETLLELTGGRGPDACIDAVGMEAQGGIMEAAYDTIKQKLHIETDRPSALREIIHACRKGGTISLAGVYGGYADKIPMGALFNKALTLKAGQTHVQRYMPILLSAIERGAVDPSSVLTHKIGLNDGPRAYEIFRKKEDGCIKVALVSQMMQASLMS